MKFIYAIKNKLQEKQGVALMTVMTIMFVLLIVVASLSTLTLANLKQSQSSATYNSTYYRAESGINYMVDKIQTLANEVYAGTLSDTLFTATVAASIPGTLQFDTNAYANLTSSFTLDNGVYTYNLESRGYEENQERVLKKTVTVQLGKKVEAVVFHPDAVLEVISTTPATIGVSGGTYTGPIVTNQPLTYANSGQTINGPLVTSAPITISGGTFGVIISSSTVTINGWPTMQGAIVLKPGGKLAATNDYYNGVSLIYLPTGANLADYLQGPTNTVNNFKAKVKYYNPVNFDPDASNDYPTLKGFTPGLAKYFKSDFVLDNPATIATRNPKIVMPTFPTAASLPKLSPVTINNHAIIDSSGNLNYTFNDGTIANLTIDHDVYIPTFNIGTIWNKVTIDVGSNNVKILTDRFIMTGELEIKGTGSLTIYVNGTATTNTTSNFQFNPIQFMRADKDSSKLVLYVGESYVNGNLITATVPAYSGSDRGFIGNIMAANLNFSIGGTYKGNIVTGGTSVTILNSGSMADASLIYAPNAVFSMQGGKFKGQLVVQSYNGANAGVTFEYSPLDWENIPLVIQDPYATPDAGGGQSGGSETVGTQPIFKLGPTIEG